MIGAYRSVEDALPLLPQGQVAPDLRSLIWMSHRRIYGTLRKELVEDEGLARKEIGMGTGREAMRLVTPR